MPAMLTVRVRPSAYADGGKAWDIVTVSNLRRPGRLAKWPTFFYVVLNFTADWRKLAARFRKNEPDPFFGDPEHNLKHRYALRMNDVPAGIRNNYHELSGGYRFFVIGNDWSFDGMSYPAHASWSQFRKYILDKHTGLNEQEAGFTPEW